MPKKLQLDNLHSGDIAIIRLCVLGAASAANEVAKITGNEAAYENEATHEQSAKYLLKIIDIIANNGKIDLLPKHFGDLKRLRPDPDATGSYAQQVGLIVARTGFMIATSAPPEVARPEVGLKIHHNSAASLAFNLGQSMGLERELTSLSEYVNSTVEKILKKPDSISSFDVTLDAIRTSRDVDSHTAEEPLEMRNKGFRHPYIISVVAALMSARSVLQEMINTYQPSPKKEEPLSARRPKKNHRRCGQPRHTLRK